MLACLQATRVYYIGTKQKFNLRILTAFHVNKMIIKKKIKKVKRNTIHEKNLRGKLWRLSKTLEGGDWFVGLVNIFDTFQCISKQRQCYVTGDSSAKEFCQQQLMYIFITLS